MLPYYIGLYITTILLGLGGPTGAFMLALCMRPARFIIDFIGACLFALGALGGRRDHGACADLLGVTPSHAYDVPVAA